MKNITIATIEEAMPLYALFTNDKGNQWYTLNALIYTLKVRLKLKTTCLASEDGYCISNISQTYVPTRHIARFIKVTEVDNENNAIFFKWVIHPTKGRYGI